jgi:hypothetical protein
MIPKRFPDRLIAQFTTCASGEFLVLAIKQCIENGYMFLISFIQPARLRFYIYNWLPFNYNITQGMVR